MDRAFHRVSLLSVISRLPAAAEGQHHNAEDEQRQSPPEVCIDAETLLIQVRAVARGEAERREYGSREREEHAHRNARIDLHGAICRSSCKIGLRFPGHVPLLLTERSDLQQLRPAE